MLLTSPVNRRSPSAVERRYVRGSSNGSGPRKWRRWNLISSLERCPRLAKGGSSAGRGLRPFSRMATDLTAAGRTSAAVEPPGPEPITTTSKSGTDDLVVGPAARLHVARVVD